LSIRPFHRLTLKLFVRVVRVVLALTNGLSVIRLSQALGRRTRDRSTVLFFLGLSVGQFHTMFYAGRPLPNFMALPIGELRHVSTGQWIPAHQSDGNMRDPDSQPRTRLLGGISGSSIGDDRRSKQDLESHHPTLPCEQHHSLGTSPPPGSTSVVPAAHPPKIPHEASLCGIFRRCWRSVGEHSGG